MGDDHRGILAIGPARYPQPPVAVACQVANEAAIAPDRGVELMKRAAVIAADAAVATEPDIALRIWFNANDRVADQAIFLGEVGKGLPVKAADPIGHGGEPELSCLVFGNVVDAQTDQAIGRGIGAPGAVGVKKSVSSLVHPDMSDRSGVARCRLIAVSVKSARAKRGR
jgi:hypothetical protein